MHDVYYKGPLPVFIPYIVRPGDSIYTMANRYNTTAEAIISVNPDIKYWCLQAGQLVRIPTQVTFIGNQPNSRCIEDMSGSIYPNLNKYRTPKQTYSPKECWKMYISEVYNVGFMYPGGWKRVDDTRYQGENGFFTISAISSDGDLETVCTNEALQTLRPYGSEPKIEEHRIQWQEACIILPSEDQEPEMKQQAALIVRYPKPVNISSYDYNFFILWTDKNHIRELSETLRFLTF